MIRRLSYEEADFEKYSECLEKSAQKKYSATKVFLDAAAGTSWDIIVAGDYEAVMPVPFVIKFGLKFVIHPKLCQQLGVFSQCDDPAQNELFKDFLVENYRVKYYAFNDKNIFKSPMAERKNFVILPDSYENVFKKYSPKRKRKLRLNPGVAEFARIQEISLEEGLPFIAENFKGAPKKSDIAEFIKTFKMLNSTGNLIVFGFFFKEQLTNITVLYRDLGSVALLGTFNDPAYIKNNGASVLVDYGIKSFVDSHIFDFEGGNIPEVEEFFRGFRPIMKPYPYVQRSNSELLKQFFV